MFLMQNLSLTEDSKKDGIGLILNNKYVTKKILLTEQEVEDDYGINKRTLQRERVYNTGIPYFKIFIYNYI